jgi:hypothetical protein
MPPSPAQITGVETPELGTTAAADANPKFAGLPCVIGARAERPWARQPASPAERSVTAHRYPNAPAPAIPVDAGAITVQALSPADRVFRADERATECFSRSSGYLLILWKMMFGSVLPVSTTVIVSISVRLSKSRS